MWIVAGIAGALGLTLVAAAWSGRPMYHRYKAERSFNQARAFLQKGDLRSGVLSLRAAVAANPAHLEATRLMADVLAEARSPAAVGWRRRVVELAPTAENRALFAATALRVEKPPFPLVTQTLEELRAGGGETNVGFHLVASQLALRLNRLENAARHLDAAATLEPTNRLHQLNLATLRLRQSESAAASHARQELAALVADPALGEHALRSLIADGLIRRQFDETDRWSQQLLALPQARFDDRLQHLAALVAAGRPQTNAWLAQLQHEAATNAIKVARVVGWMTGNGQPRPALDWLDRLDPKVRTAPPLPLVEAECHVALNDWPALERFLDGQNWDEQDPLRLVLLTRALREQGRREMADMQWRRALSAGGRAGEALGTIAQVTAAWGWADETEEALWTLVKRAPWQNWAWDALLHARTAAGDTPGLYRVYSALLETKPDAPVFKNNTAATGLLLNRDLEKCARLAREVYLADTNNGTFASTYAFALHVQGKTADGLRILQTLPETERQQPSVATYYALLLAASDRHAQAAPYFAAAAQGLLLPEEKRLLESARAGN
jgi:predicted Zn-dependent protease